MSRIIKFRAWSTANKQMYDRVLAGPGDPCSIVWKNGEWINFDFACGEIMQFTGLLDKNSKEICESDICRIDGETYEVYWNEDRWGLREVSPMNGCKFDYDNGDYYQPHEIIWSECEIIGNIHENSNPLRGAIMNDNMVNIIRINTYIQRNMGTLFLFGKKVLCVSLDRTCTFAGEGEDDIMLTDAQLDDLLGQTNGNVRP